MRAVVPHGLGEPEKIARRERHRRIVILGLNLNPVQHEPNPVPDRGRHGREAPLQIFTLHLEHAGPHRNGLNFRAKKVDGLLKLVRIRPETF